MYRRTIIEVLAGRDYDPRHIEAFMRVRYGTLDSLTMPDFRREVELSILVIDQVGRAFAEEVAECYAL